MRGDYAQAAQLLRPLVEEGRQPDPIASFFLALLYRTGSGVPADGMRACGLFLTAAVPGTPFFNQAQALAAALQDGHACLRSLCEAATFVNAAGIRMKQTRPIVLTAIVGRTFG
jgi:TPR repeat protein